MLTAKRKKIEILFFYFHDNLILQNCLQKVFVVCMPLEQWAGQTLVAKRGLILSDFTRGQSTMAPTNGTPAQREPTEKQP